MKNVVSGFFKFIAILYMIFPVVFSAAVAILFDIQLSEMVPIFLSPFFYLVCALAILTGFALWEVKRWSWHVFVFTNIWILYEAITIAANYGESHHKILALFSIVLVMAVFGVRITTEIRVPYFFPRIRWWETGSRGFCAIPVSLQSQNGKTAQGEMLDLSLAGCFVKTPEWFDSPTREDRVTIQFQHARQSLKCQGVILWRASSTVTSPRGVGIRFSRLERVERKMLRIVIHRIKRDMRRALKSLGPR